MEEVGDHLLCYFKEIIMELTSEIKDMKTWDEANLWLERHGWGPALIAGQKEIWDAAHAPKPAAHKPTAPKPAAPKPAVVSAPKIEVKSIKKGK